MNTFTIGATVVALITLVSIVDAVYEELDYVLPAEDEELTNEKRYYMSTSCRRCMHSPNDYGACISCYSRAGSFTPYFGTRKRAFDDLYSFLPEDYDRQVAKRSTFLSCKCCLSLGRNSCCNKCGFRPGSYAKRGYETSFVGLNSYGGCSCCESAFFNFSCCRRCLTK